MFALRFAAIATAALLAAGPRLDSSVATAPYPDRDALMRAVSRLSSVAAGIAIDGRLDDWEGIPFLSCALGDVAEAGRDIVGVSMAATERDLAVAVRTRGAPSAEPYSFYLDLYLAGGSRRDFQIGLHGRGDEVRVFTRHGSAYRGGLPGLEVALGESVELRIPFQSLVAIVDPGRRVEIEALWRDGEYARIRPFSYVNRAGTKADEGIAYAAYKFTPSAPWLRAPELPEPRLAIPPPFEGVWFAISAMLDEGSWDYDFVVKDERYASGPTESPDRLDGFYAWGRTVVAPVDGVVTRTENATVDNPPGAMPDDPGVNNGVWLSLPDGTTLILVHFMRGSVLVGKGAIAAGTPLGHVGNSGRSPNPHLHFSAVDREGRTLPVTLARVVVKLNRGADDPWAYVEDEWLIRAGYFVEGLGGW
jgi:hypothetical protein